MAASTFDPRPGAAAAIEPGEPIRLFDEEGPIVAGLVTDVHGVDVDVRLSRADGLRVGTYFTARVRGRLAAWLVTFDVRGFETVEDDSAVLYLRVTDAVRVVTGRWAERVATERLALLRPEGPGAELARGTVVDVSLIGAGILVPTDDLALHVRLAVTIADADGGEIAFRGLVARSARLGAGRLLGVEILGISRADHTRLARLVRGSAGAA